MEECPTAITAVSQTQNPIYEVEGIPTWVFDKNSKWCEMPIIVIPIKLLCSD